MIRRRNPFPGVSTKPDRHGKLRHRLRRTVGGRKVDAYLPGPHGSPEFRAAYEEAIEGARVTTRRAQPGTFSHLIETYLDSTAFRNLADTTRSDKRPRLDWIRAAIGDAGYARMQPRQVEALMTKKGGPAASNKLKKDLAQLFRFAAKHFAFRSPNPAALADSYKIRSSGFHSWTDEEITGFRNHFPSGSQARLALELFLGTGAARQDAAGMTRANVRGAQIHYSRKKNWAGGGPADNSRVGTGTRSYSPDATSASGAWSPRATVYGARFGGTVPPLVHGSRLAASLPIARASQGGRAATGRGGRDRISNYELPRAQESHGGGALHRGGQPHDAGRFGGGEVEGHTANRVVQP